MEYNPMEELGLINEKQFITSCNGVLSENDYARDLCAKIIRNGERFFDIVSRYEDLTTFILERNESKSIPSMKMIIPFLKSYGLTDHMAYSFAKDDLRLVPGSAETMGYLNSLLPSFVTTGSFEHHVMAVSEAIDFPIENFTHTQIDFDTGEINKQEARMLRDLANEIASLRLPKTMYTLTDAEYLEPEDDAIVTKLDKIFLETIPKMEVNNLFKEIQSVGANEKAYALLEIRKKTEIDFSSTVYVGNGINDSQALDFVRDSSGLAIAYNGSEYAIRGCNVAVMSNNNIVLAVLASEFYNEGIEAVYDMIDNWDREKLQSHKCSDRNLMNRMLEVFPKKLPIVKKVGRRNADDIVRESTEYRKKFQR